MIVEIFMAATQGMHKMAEVVTIPKPRKRRKRYYLFGKRIKSHEARNIEKAVKAVKAKTPEERKIRRLAGKRPTKKQLARWATIGAAGGVMVDVAGSAITGGSKWLPKVPAPSGQAGRAVLHPRRLAKGAVIGAIYGAGIPVTRRLADIEAAKKGKY